MSTNIESINGSLHKRINGKRLRPSIHSGHLTSLSGTHTHTQRSTTSENIAARQSEKNQVCEEIENESTRVDPGGGDGDGAEKMARMWTWRDQLWVA